MFARQARTNVETSDLLRELENLHEASFGWALWCCHQRRDEAEEVLQMAYLRVLEKKATFGGRSSFRTWFFGVIWRTASELQRRKWVRQQLLHRWFTGRPQSPVVTPSELLEADASRVRLRAAVDRLPQRQQQVLHLVFYQDLTIEEAASVLGISLGTARTHFERGKRSLRHILASEEVRG